MSRGLGIMQRRILTALRTRGGGDRVSNSADYGFILAPGIHDMRKVSHELAVANGGISHCHYHTQTWEASFARALAGLIAKGYVEAPSLVRVFCEKPEAYDESAKAVRTSDGLFLLDANRRQHRFVQVLCETQKYITLKRIRRGEAPAG